MRSELASAESPQPALLQKAEARLRAVAGSLETHLAAQAQAQARSERKECTKKADEEEQQAIAKVCEVVFGGAPHMCARERRRRRAS